MNISRHAYPILGIFTVLTAASLGAPHMKVAMSSPTTNTNIVNTASNPIPTAAQGNTAVTQSGTWSVGLSPTAAVSINNAPGSPANVTGTVNVASSAANPIVVRDADTSARTPVNVQGGLNIDDGSDTANVQIYFVPYNKRLVIQTIYGIAHLPSGQRVAYGQIIDYLNSNRAWYPLQFQYGGFDAFENFSSISQVEINVRPGTQVSIAIGRTGTTGFGDCQIGFSGYLVDAA